MKNLDPLQAHKAIALPAISSQPFGCRRASGIPATRQFLTMSNPPKLTNKKEPSGAKKYRAVDVLVVKDQDQEKSTCSDNVVDILLQLIRRTDPHIQIQRFK